MLSLMSRATTETIKESTQHGRALLQEYTLGKGQAK